MKKLGIVLAGTVLLAACGQENAEVKTDDQKASYALGFRSAEQMRSLENLDLDAMVAGLRDGFDEKGESRLGDEDLDQLIRDFQGRMMAAQQKKVEEEAGKNLEASEKFLADNAERDGVTVTDSGMQYEVLASGEEGAASPTLNDTVEVHYHGTLPDGTVFDSSVEREQPATFGLQQIIPGWQEALPMMKEGDKWKIVLPPSLAYGEQGAGGDIGPNQVLIFEIELLDVKGSGDEASADEE
ncbi:MULTISPECIES: FKBP-type peptidyl-prolyl cis-trans isomerase [unclassified Alcanivorax]|jgi:FKBP-type peptidyl-prolyl cis-trans isomerase FklB|uniref:FKBP-type peptidyl-prolyl cis-trans isomerase n=1 Tax=unclassified Alcanivorax TaxID=2638842 RepID=UPI00017EB9E0|nr:MULTISPECIES: FKBP-type peptidyl-prolyl cis-trans isomerase [unclassified Alcanivorax]EDX88097.1 peptidyl-prolyl cis-trans isomerase, FKBP-type domain protein [Alcanivorax sp. DG881]HIL22801.1 FKBP-type peptidyl-prolyl cis-trans isomerase [Alcanivorax sp.]